MGTSNSLIKGGWVEGLRHSLPDAKIVNISIGASPGVQFAAEIDRNFTEFDFVIFDSVPNDEEYNSRNKGYSSNDFVCEIIQDILTTIASQTRLIVLGICTQMHFYKESVTYSSRRSITALCKAQFIDTRSIIKNNAQSLMLITNASSLYDVHPAHPFPPIMKIIGSALGQAISKLPNSVHTIEAQQVNTYNKYYRTGAPEYRTEKLTTLTNSLLTETFAVLGEQDCIEFSAEANCIGFYVNHAATNAKLELNTADQSIFINLANNRTSKKLLKVFVALPNGPTVRSIRVHAPANAECKDYNPLVFSKYSSKNLTASLQLSSSVFFKPAPAQLYIAPFLDEGRLQALVSENLEKLCEARMNSRASTSELKTSSIKNSFGQYIFFDLTRNRCIALDSRCVSRSVNNLHPVFLFHNGHEGMLRINVHDSIFTLSLYSQSISLDDRSPFNLPPPNGSFVGNVVEFTKGTSSTFSILCNGQYVFSAPSHDLACNRSEAKRCETFSLDMDPPQLGLKHPLKISGE